VLVAIIHLTPSLRDSRALRDKLGASHYVEAFDEVYDGYGDGFLVRLSVPDSITLSEFLSTLKEQFDLSVSTSWLVSDQTSSTDENHPFPS